MVIVPRVLVGLLGEVDESLGEVLALDFAERALTACRDSLTGDEHEHTRAYLAAARRLLSGEGGIQALADARTAFFDARSRNTQLSDDITWVAEIAVSACFRRLMEESRIVLYRERRLSTVASVAREAQTVAGRHAAQAAGGSAEPAAEIARRARWEEARWQLGHLVSSVPFPAERASATDGSMKDVGGT
jgi:hypothetical protein